ncbi:MAG: enoyl-CoA hydratase/isomerase family protein [Chloroflexi bacterium]|nr:enoyl-CoA hydratase/isomerase family protein [Chloroflexota bacterium]MCH8007965.1 enoyl-CoA hydratase/isomerase family protein [Chloroflexota bacterium]MCH8160650.1 enoyl-CoA hydratase/isomerase family protein [Chloroflexota bacterium]
MSNVLEITNAGHVRKLRLNRPEKKNALSDELAWGIISAVEEAAKDDDVWIIAITGTDDAFCSGLDLTPSSNGAHPYLSTQDALLDDLGWVSRIPLVLREQCDKPIVAGLNGVAVGAGFSLAMAADIRLASESVRLIAGYPRIGGSPDGGLSFTLAQAIGYEQAMRFLLENRTVGAEEALKLGLVGEVVPDNSFDERFDEYCQSLTKISPITARLTKRVVRRATAMVDPESHYRYELQNITRAFTSEDGKEAGKAFREKRTPEFKGR